MAWLLTGLLMGMRMMKSGNGHNGTMHGGITNTTDRFGNANSAFLFNGLDGYISIPTLDTIKYRPLTYSAWVIVKAYIPNTWGFKFKAIIGRNTAYVLECGVLGFFADGGAYDNNFIMWRGGSTSGVPCIVNKTPPINTWVHIVFTHDINGDWKWYQNGELTSSGNFTDIQNQYDYFQIGGCNNQTNGYNGNSFWNDKIDDIGMWNRALTPAEITNLYQGKNTPDVANIIQNDTTICKREFCFIKCI
jgi:hypothetical protein